MNDTAFLIIFVSKMYSIILWKLADVRVNSIHKFLFVLMKFPGNNSDFNKLSSTLYSTERLVRV